MADDQQLDKQKQERLPQAVKAFIVVRLACFMSPSEVERAIKDELGADVPRQQIALYDPTKAAGEKLSKTLKALFEQTRAEYLEQTTDVAIANKRYRLEVMQEIVEREREAGRFRNDETILRALDQAAKERGGYVQKHELTGKDGGPIQIEERRVGVAKRMLTRLLASGMTDAEARAALVGMGVDERDLTAVQTD